MNAAGIRTEISRRALLFGALVPALMLSMLIGSSQAGASEVVPRSAFTDEWTGPAANSRLGDALSSVGDINGDGIVDFLAPVNSGDPNYFGHWILFGPLNPNSSPSLTDLAPSEGYRITTDPFQGPAYPVGDQNGDGLTDIVVTPNGPPVVIYGVSDPATLPKCDPLGTPATRCINGGNPVDSEGDRLGFSVSYSSNLAQAPAWAGADVDGDEVDELIIPTMSANKVLVAKNDLGSACAADPGLCTIDLTELTGTDLIEIDGPSATIPFGVTVRSPGDVNADGREDILVLSGTDGSEPPAVWIVYGQDWTESPVATSTFRVLRATR